MEENKIALARNEVALARRELEEREARLGDIKENYDILCDEADQKMKDIKSVKTSLVEVQTDLSDVDQFLRDNSGGNSSNEDTLQGLMKQYSGRASNPEEAMVARVLEVIQQSGKQNAKLIPPELRIKSKTATKKVQVVEEVHHLDKVKVTFYPAWPGKDEQEDEGTVAFFKVVRNYSFEDLLDDCCRYWNLFPPDMQLLNRVDGKWNLEKLVEDQYNKTKGRGFEVKIKYMEDEAEEKVEDDGNLDDLFDIGGDADEVEVDTTQQWPPPFDRRRLIIEMFYYIIFALCYITYIQAQRPTQTCYNLNQAMQTYIVEEEWGGTLRLTYPDIRTGEELGDFIMEVLVGTLNGDAEYTNGDTKPIDELGFILDVNRIVGGIQMKQHRVKAKECPVTAREEESLRLDPDTTRKLVPDCYAAYSSGSRSKEPYGDNPEIPGFEWVDNRGGESDDGYYAQYPASGFIANTTLTPYTIDDYEDQVQAILDNGWLDGQTRAVILNMMFYNANYKQNTQVKFIIEQTPAGEYQPFPAKITSWELYTFKFQFKLTSILLCIIGAFIIFYMYTERRQWRNCKRVTGKYTKYFSDPFNIIELVIIATTCAWGGLIGFLAVSNVYQEWTYFRSTYPDMQNYLVIQRQLFMLYSIIIFLLVLKLFKYFPLVHDLDLLWKMLKVAGASLANFLLMLLVLQIGFVFIANMIFGTQLSDFSTPWKSFINLFLYFLGDFDYYALYGVSQIWGMSFFVIIQVLMVLVMLNIFLAILNDAYIDVFNSEEEEARRASQVGMKQRTWKDYARLLQKSIATNIRGRRKKNIEDDE